MMCILMMEIPPAHGLVNVPAGYYDFIVTDATGCSSSVTVLVEDGPPVTADFTITPIACFGQMTGGITITNISGPPFLRQFLTGMMPLLQGIRTLEVRRLYMMTSKT